MVPACPARCLRWSPYVQMPAPSGTRIGAVSSTVRGVEVLFRSLLTVPLRSRSLLSLRNVRMGLARVLLTNACSLGWLCCGLLALPARNGKQHLALSLNPLAPLLRRSGCGFFLGNAAAERVHEVHSILRPRRGMLPRYRQAGLLFLEHLDNGFLIVIHK